MTQTPLHGCPEIGDRVRLVRPGRVSPGGLEGQVNSRELCIEKEREVHWMIGVRWAGFVQDLYYVWPGAPVEIIAKAMKEA